LGVERGRVIDLPDAERGYQHGIRTNRDVA